MTTRCFMTSEISGRSRKVNTSGLGFTLVELLVVLLTIAVLSSLLLPALAKTGTKSHEAQCLYNQKRLALAWVLYASDNGRKICRTAGLDSLVSSDNPTKNYPINQWCMGTMDTAPSWTNQVLVMDSLLFKYVGNLEAYHCPADPSSIQNKVLNPRGGGGIRRVRSVSMNGWMNPINPWRPDSAIGGHSVKNFRVLADIQKPSLTFVIIDVNPAAINSGWFVCDPVTQGTWVDVPAVSHDGAGSLSFADGHSEIKKWRDPALYGPGAGIGAAIGNGSSQKK